MIGSYMQKAKGGQVPPARPFILIRYKLKAICKKNLINCFLFFQFHTCFTLTTLTS